MAKTAIEFNRKASKELNRLARQLGIDKCEVVRLAITTYSCIVSELAKTEKNLAIIGKDGKAEKIITVPGLKN
jgi:hypothetical protein